MTYPALRREPISLLLIPHPLARFSAMGQGPQINFWQELKARHVLQLVGFYLGGSWVALEFLGFLTDHYGLSPYLIDLILLAIGAMLPSVMVLAYTHGKPGKDRWTLVDKVVIPVNVLLTIGLMIIFFRGKDLGATTLMVTAEDETGTIIERAIPKSTFRKRIGLFFFNNQTGNPEVDWVGRWLPYGIFLDMVQDYFFDNRNPYQMSRALIEAGVEDGDAPLALMREMARRFHLTYFLEGSLRSALPYTVETRLYLTRSGRLVTSHDYTDEDLGSVVDRIAVDIKRDVELSASQIAEAEDLPVTALSSGNPQALANFVGGLDRFYFHDDWPGAIQRFAAAVEEDPTFAQAQLNLYLGNSIMGRETGEIIDIAMQYLYKVPERLQGTIKEVYYLSQGMPEKAQAALQLDVTLFPEDVIAHRRLGRFYSRRAQYGDALEEYRIIRALNLDDDRVLMDIAAAHSAMGQFTPALENLHTYAKSNPRDTDVLIEMGAVYQLLGQTGAAAKVYERASLLGYNQARVLSREADLLFQQGEYEAALDRAGKAIAAAQALEIQLEVLHAQERIYESLGRIDEAMQIARKAMPLERRRYGPVASIVIRLRHFNKYARTSLADSAEVLLAGMDRQLPDPWDRAARVVQVLFKLSREDKPVSAEEIALVELFYDEYELLADVPPVELIMARIQASNQEYRRAIQGYITTLSHYPRRLKIQSEIARAYLKMGQGEAALATINQLLAIYPNDPDALHELYKIQLLVDEATARKTLLRLGEIWSTADEVFLPAREIRARLAERPAL